MNIIAVDIGNTETCIGIGNIDTWESFRFTTRTTITSDEWLMMMKATLPEIDGKTDGTIICSVVPQVNRIFIDALTRYSCSTPILLGPGIKTGLSVKIDNPKELGPDRIANSVGGVDKVNSPVIIVDLGTATTVDVVNSRKEYIGGLIAPGLKIISSNHSFSKDRIPLGGSPVIIGNNVWIGANVIILPEVNIGDNSILSAINSLQKWNKEKIYGDGSASKIIVA